MNENDFMRWKEKLKLINETNQIPKVISFAKKLDSKNKIPKNLKKNNAFTQLGGPCAGGKPRLPK